MTGGAGTIRRVPNQPKTPVRSFRSPDEIFLPAVAEAKERGETITDVINRVLKRYGAAQRRSSGNS